MLEWLLTYLARARLSGFLPPLAIGAARRWAVWPLYAAKALIRLRSTSRAGTAMYHPVTSCPASAHPNTARWIGLPSNACAGSARPFAARYCHRTRLRCFRGGHAMIYYTRRRCFSQKTATCAARCPHGLNLVAGMIGAFPALRYAGRAGDRSCQTRHGPSIRLAPPRLAGRSPSGYAVIC